MEERYPRSPIARSAWHPRGLGHRVADRGNRVHENVPDVSAPDLAGTSLFVRYQGHVNGARVLLGDLGPEAELHSDERDAEIQATIGRHAGYYLKDQLDRSHLQVPGGDARDTPACVIESLTTLIVASGLPYTV